MDKDILTGQDAPWRFSRALGCGSVAGCQSLLFLRSGAAGLYDIENRGMANFGGVKPSCGTSIIAANGLLLLPEGSSGCSCSYNFQTSLALVPVSHPQNHDAWYTFYSLASHGNIKHVGLNLGAPGDRRDANGLAWLGLPQRPWLRNACPAPATVLMQEPSWYANSLDRVAIKASPSPWIYTSGLCGRGAIAVDLTLRRNVIVPTCKTPPAVDGRLDDPCWQQARPVPFSGNAHILAPQAALFIRKDADNLYFAYRRKAAVQNGKPLPFVASRTGSQAPCWLDDDLELYIADATRRNALYLGVSASGGSFAGTPSVHRQIWAPRTGWRGNWSHAVRKSADEWTAEITLPLKSLAAIPINTNTLRINCMARNLSGHGPEKIYLTDPLMEFFRCQEFLPVIEKVPALPERSFTVRLHFADLDNTAPGQRSFNVALQSRPVLQNLDIIREAAAPNTALVKEFTHVKARDILTITLDSPATSNDPRALPIISGIEIREE